MEKINEDLYFKRDRLIQWISNQEDKLADEHWFDDYRDGTTSRKKMEKQVKEMYIELNEVRDKIKNLK